MRKRIGGALGCMHLREVLAPGASKATPFFERLWATTSMLAVGGVLRGRRTGQPRQGAPGRGDLLREV